MQRVVISEYDEQGSLAKPVVTENNGKSGVAITPNDTTVIDATKGGYIGGAGNLTVTMSDGNDVTFTAITAGMIHPISVTKVKATGTTATSIIAIY